MFRFLAALALIGMAVLFPVHAGETTILIVGERGVPVHADVGERLAAQLDDGRLNLVRRFADEPRQTANPELVITLGTPSLTMALKSYPGVPVLALLVTSESFAAAVGSTASAAPVSALYLDIPLARQIELIGTRLPHVRRLGIIHADVDSWVDDAVMRSAENAGIAIEESRLRDTDSLDRDFASLISRAQAILALPDPRVFNRETIVRLLTTAYRAGVPIIGYSETLARAGAIMTVYASSDDITADAAVLVRRILASPSASPVRQYPQRYTVKINRQVARSLGIKVHD